MLPPACMRGDCSQVGEPANHMYDNVSEKMRPVYTTFKGLQKIHGSIVEVVSAGKIFNAGTTKLCLMEGKRYGIKNNKGVYSMQYAW